MSDDEESIAVCILDVGQHNPKSIFFPQKRLSGQSIDRASKREMLMKQIKKHFSGQPGSRVVRVETKNIVIIGRSRTGKSTIKSMLVNPAATPVDISLLSGTREATMESYFIDSENLILNIIDTPGVFEHNSEQALIRDNAQIMTTIEKCINLEITKFHLICFAFSMPAGIQSDDIEALELFIKYLGPDLARNSCLVITRAEGKTEEQKKKLREELLNDREFKSVSHYFERGIFFTGSINYDDYLNASSAIVDQYKNVLTYRTDLLNEFSKNYEPFQINESFIGEVNRIKKQYEDKCKDLESKLARSNQNDEQRKEIEKLKKELQAEKNRMVPENQCLLS